MEAGGSCRRRKSRFGGVEERGRDRHHGLGEPTAGFCHEVHTQEDEHQGVGVDVRARATPEVWNCSLTCRLD